MESLWVDPLVILVGALVWDFFWGEMPSAIHPVVYIGNFTTYFKQWHQPYHDKKVQVFTGALVAIIIISVITLMVVGYVRLVKDYPVLYFFLSVYLLKSTFALTALKDAAMNVAHALGKKDLLAARLALAALCSRDAATLNEEDLASATIASVAENAGDSFIAPIFYYLIFGLPGAFFYRAVNTLDAMVGYRGQYEYFGKFSARLDDLANFIPARITALFLLITGLMLGKKYRRAAAISWRHHQRTPSPNGGWPMSMMAGLLGIEIVKPGCYRLGLPEEKIDVTKIAEALNVYMFMALIAVLSVFGYFFLVL